MRSSSTLRRVLPALEWLLVSPAALFLTAVFVRNLQPQANEPARSAQRIVTWYAQRPWTLWVLLRALPLTVLALGLATLHSRWRDEPGLRGDAHHALGAVRAHLATLLVAAATLTAAGVLAIVVLHALAD